MNSRDYNRAEHDAELRQLAEDIAWKKAPRSPERLSPGDIQKIIHELRVHQIELEMQNEELHRTQLELDAARERYFDFYNVAPAGFFTVSEQGLILEANLTAATLLGATGKELDRQPFSRFVLKDDRDIYYLQCKQLFKSGKQHTFELRMVKKDNTSFYAQLSNTVLQDVDGNSICRIVLSDITGRKQSEELLRQKEVELREILEATADGILAVDRLGRVIKMNHRFVEMWRIPQTLANGGYDQAMLNHVLSQLSDPDGFIKKVQTLYDSIKYDMDILEFKDGRVYERYSSPLMMDSSLTGRVWSFRDITERKRTEEALRESEQFLKETQVIANLGTYIFDIIADRWQSSEVLDKILGIDADFDKSFAGWRAIIHPEWQKVMTDYFIQEVLGGKNNFDKEYKIIRQNDHAERWVHGIGKLKFNDKNQPVTMVGTIRDITEQKHAEEALRMSEARLQKIISNTHAGYFFIDRDGRYQRVNDAWLRMHGYDSPDEVIGRPFTLTQVDAALEDARKIVDTMLAGDTIQTGEFSRRCRDGSIRYHTFSAQPVVESGVIVGVEGFIIDATGRKRAEDEIKLKNEELLKINGEKDKFFSIIAHDLRSPFHSFLMLTKIMAQGSSHLTMDKIREIAADMRDSATNIFRLLENLLQWAMTQQGLMRMALS